MIRGTEVGMVEIMQAAVNLDAGAARAIAAAMREVAAADGEHPHEMELIRSFEAELPPGSSGDLDALTTREQKEVLLRSLVLLGLADGAMSAVEQGRIHEIAARVGLGPDDVARASVEVASAMLSQFKGVHVFRDQVVALGHSLGLDDATIHRVID